LNVTRVQGQTGRGTPEDAIGAALAAELERIRQRTLELIAPLSDEVLAQQPCEFMSPPIWDLGHIAEFERRWLIDAVEGRAGARLEERFDAELTPRQQRGGLTLPCREEVLEGLARVRNDTLELLATARLAGADRLLRDGFVYRMVMQHEAQHQETLLQTLDLLEQPTAPGRRADATENDAGERRPGDVTQQHAGAPLALDDEERITVPAGPFLMGTEDRSRSYDNERRRHEVAVGGFAIERYPVSNRRWIAFIDDGGYRRRDLWSDDGWSWREDRSVAAPQGWGREGGVRQVRRFGCHRDVDPREPVQHVSFWEAQAFARWCGGRLPSEAEWEKAASWGPRASAPRIYPWGDGAAPGDQVGGALTAGRASDGPPPIGTRPGRASAYGVDDLLGCVYQWTDSPFAPYPGFEAFPYPGYSEVFFGDRYRVLRGSSWAADPILWRTTYRNWDLPQRRQIFAGVRVVYDL